MRLGAGSTGVRGVALALAIGLSPILAADGSNYRYRMPSPMGTVLFARAECSWPIWSDDGLKVKKVEMEIDGTSVSARYDTLAQAVVHRPASPLAPGSHAAVCRVTLDGDYVAVQKWTFQVSPDAVGELPSPNALQQSAHAAVNRRREALGLSNLRPDPALCAAASFQAAFLSKSGALEHVRPDGSTPTDRCAAFGFAGPVSELIAFNPRSTEAAIGAIYDAPYHRAAFLARGGGDIGSSFQDGYTTLLLSTRGGTGRTLSPADGESDVPTSWDGNETPDPAAGTGLSGPFGYPAVLSEQSGVAMGGIQAELLAEGGKVIPTIVRHPENDSHAQNLIIVLPKRPLTPGKRYEVRVTYRLGLEPIEAKWSFTTSR